MTGKRFLCCVNSKCSSMLYVTSRVLLFKIIFDLSVNYIIIHRARYLCVNSDTRFYALRHAFTLFSRHAHK